MPINRSWCAFSEDAINFEQDEPGVYELGDSASSIIYIGSSSKVLRRLKEHLNEWSTTCLKKHAAKYRVEYTVRFKAREWELYGEHIRTHRIAPMCNVRTEFSHSTHAF